MEALVDYILAGDNPADSDAREGISLGSRASDNHLVVAQGECRCRLLTGIKRMEERPVHFIAENVDVPFSSDIDYLLEIFSWYGFPRRVLGITGYIEPSVYDRNRSTIKRVTYLRIMSLVFCLIRSFSSSTFSSQSFSTEVFQSVTSAPRDSGTE